MSETTKILYLITKSNFGGAQKYVFELASEAKNRGHKVVVASGGTGEKNGAPGKLVEKLLSTGITVRPVNHFLRDMSLIDDIKAFTEVLGLLYKEKPDVLHVTSSKAGGIGVVCGRLAGIKKIIFTSHGLTMDETWRPGWQRVLITWFTWLTIFLSHHSIMISTETYNRVRKLPLLSNRVSLVFNGVKPINFKNQQEARVSLAPDIPPDSVWLGGVGELHPNKNWQSLIRATKTFPLTVHTVIIGAGEEETQLNGLISKLELEERVHLLGYVEAAEYLKAFDIFVLPSKKEGLPYVLLEAGLAKLPVVASDLPGNHDIVTPNQSGLLISPEPDALAESLLSLIEDSGKMKTFGEKLNQNVREKFSMSVMLEKTFSLYSV